MVVPLILEGTKEKASSKGKIYAEVYAKGVDDDGNADMVQRRFMCFEEDVINQLRSKKPGDCVNLVLEIKEATVVGVGV